MNPVHKCDGKWYFWLETWNNKIGPYNTKEEAKEALTRYCKVELGYKNNHKDC